MHTSHSIPGRHRNYYYYLLSILFVYSFDPTIFSEVQAVQDIIHPLMNHTLTSDHLLRPCVHLAGSI